MRWNSSTTMSATLGSTRSRSANRLQNCLPTVARPKRCGSRPELRAQQAHDRVIAALDERHRGTQQAQARDALGMPQPDLERDAAAERVADDVRALDAQGVHDAGDACGEEARVVGRSRGLARGAEAGQVDRVHAVGAAERRRRVEERGLGRPEAVEQQHVGAVAHRQGRDAGAARRRTSCMRSSGARPLGRRKRPSKPTARSRLPRA